MIINACVLNNRFAFALLLLALLLLGACEPQTAAQAGKAEPRTDLKQAGHADAGEGLDSAKVVARYGKHEITLAELDDSLQLTLYDMEWRKYQLRSTQLFSLLLDLKRGDEKVEVFLKRPQPPRLEVPQSSVVVGNSEAAIQLSVFCSFQSSHCARLQPVVNTLNEAYRELIGFHYFDNPQPFHRFGKSAANAARCAHEYAVYAPFAEALYMDVSNLNDARFTRIAGQLGVNPKFFKECLREKRYLGEVDSDINLSNELGLGNVPVVLINGLYTKGVLELEDYQYFINAELARQGLANYKPVEELSDLTDQEADQETEEQQSPLRPQTESDQDQNANPQGERVLPSSGKMTLSKDWLRSELRNRDELEKHVQNAEHVVNGMYNLVKLKNLENSPFYETLGLKENDVLMQVNGEWVHSGQNPLWTALTLEEPITLIIMRNGLPLRYDYVMNQE